MLHGVVGADEADAMTIGSLFSGIGGIELGLERAGLGPVKWQVEIDPWCQRVLAKHWPHAERFHDVRTVGSDLPSVDLICGGFPCQDVSSAGARAGLDGSASGLWREYSRIVADCRPKWVVIENVASGAALWVDAVLGELERLGYSALPIPLAASDCGALHLRKRIFIVAHSDSDREFAQPLDAKVAESSTTENRPTWDGGMFAEPNMVRMVDGISKVLDRRRIRALGNSVVPQCAEVIGHVIRKLACT